MGIDVAGYLKEIGISTDTLAQVLSDPKKIDTNYLRLKVWLLQLFNPKNSQLQTMASDLKDTWILTPEYLSDLNTYLDTYYLPEWESVVSKLKNYVGDIPKKLKILAIEYSTPDTIKLRLEAATGLSIQEIVTALTSKDAAMKIAKKVDISRVDIQTLLDNGDVIELALKIMRLRKLSEVVWFLSDIHELT